MDTINFNMMQMIVSSKEERFVAPTFNTFQSLSQKDNFTFNENYFYEVNIENKEEYLWMYFDYGKTKPRDINVTNIITGTKKDNHRGVDEVELLNQIFCIYYYKKHTLYMSNIKQKSIVEKFLKERLEIDVNIKYFYKTPEEFIDALISVDKISFTYVTDLFNADSRKRQALIDLTGTDSPDRFTIEAKYDKHSIKNFLRDLIKSKEKYEIKDLVICGLDDDKFGIVYNSETFVKKIDILCDKIEETGKFNEVTAKENIINKIRDER